MLSGFQALAAPQRSLQETTTVRSRGLYFTGSVLIVCLFDTFDYLLIQLHPAHLSCATVVKFVLEKSAACYNCEDENV